jgi:hypothetical protein
MQRRAAAIYFVFFLVVGAGAYAYIGVAEQTSQPQYDLEGPIVESNGTAEIDGTEYQLSGIQREGGSHGSGGELVSELTWTNESYVASEAISNNSTVDYQNDSYRVVIANESGVSEFTLRAEQNVSQILQNDPAVENTTADRDGTRYVVYRDNDTIQPLAEYLPEPETVTVSEGDTFPYDGNDATVVNVTTSEVVLEWDSSQENTVELTEGANITLANGQQYFANYHGHGEVEIVPASQYADYVQTNNERDSFQTRLNGLWGIAIISALAALTVLSTAYLPVRG